MAATSLDAAQLQVDERRISKHTIVLHEQVKRCKPLRNNPTQAEGARAPVDLYPSYARSQNFSSQCVAKPDAYVAIP